MILWNDLRRFLAFITAGVVLGAVGVFAACWYAKVAWSDAHSLRFSNVTVGIGGWPQPDSSAWLNISGYRRARVFIRPWGQHPTAYVVDIVVEK